MSIISIEIPALFGDQNQVYLQSHPGLSNPIYFEIGVNSLWVASALVLNFLFYTKRKMFPMLTVCHVAATALFLIATTTAINAVFPDGNMTRSYVGVVRMLICAGAMIPYLLTSSDIKTRFDGLRRFQRVVESQLIFTEVALAAHSASAACTGRAWRSGLGVSTFGDGAGSAADEALDVSAALRALVDGVVRHLLAFLKMASAFIA